MDSRPFVQRGGKSFYALIFPNSELACSKEECCCTDEIFRGLAEMYTADARFAQNIDAAGGEGTAAFAKQAIEAYLAGK